jgi:crotonobetainyl-CoA:carnitine CoA-transferase CaiB-like acyl-CoA transferase
LIYATIRGYGFGNSFTEWPGNERNAQGMSEVSALMTGKDGEPADVRSAQDPVSARETLSSR